MTDLYRRKFCDGHNILVLIVILSGRYLKIRKIDKFEGKRINIRENRLFYGVRNKEGRVTWGKILPEVANSD